MADFVFLGLPTHAEHIHPRTAQAAYQGATRRFNLLTMEQGRACAAITPPAALTASPASATPCARWTARESAAARLAK